MQNLYKKSRIVSLKHTNHGMICQSNHHICIISHNSHYPGFVQFPEILKSPGILFCHFPRLETSRKTRDFLAGPGMFRWRKLLQNTKRCVENTNSLTMCIWSLENLQGSCWKRVRTLINALHARTKSQPINSQLHVYRQALIGPYIDLRTI